MRVSATNIHDENNVTNTLKLMYEATSAAANSPNMLMFIPIDPDFWNISNVRSSVSRIYIFFSFSSSLSAEAYRIVWNAAKQIKLQIKPTLNPWAKSGSTPGTL
jgi:hypothetical protein